MTAILVCGLILSLLLVFFAGGARLLFFKPNAEILVEIRLENMDGAAAEALLSETELSLDGSTPLRIVARTAAEPQMLAEQSRDGRILLVPSAHLFTARLTLLATGQIGEDGFLALGKHRLLAGAVARLDGERMTAEGRILSLSAKDPKAAAL